MNQTIVSSAPQQHSVPRITRHSKNLGWLGRLCRQQVLARLGSLANESLTLVEGGQTHHFGVTDDNSLVLTIENPAAWTAIGLGGTVGAGASYARGEWSTSDLTGVVRLLCKNRHVLEAVDSGLAALAQPLMRLVHWSKRNTIEGSMRNIHAHYDIGNEFFELMLDETMLYSAALYPHPAASLLEAQINKCEALCRQLDLQSSDHLLEIGTGWGGFAIYAARNYGCTVTTTTISREQYDLAKRRIEAAGLSDQVTILLEDYRDLRGRFDKIVSIEMIEAVGHKFYPLFFERCQELLRPDGVMVMQAITIADNQYERAKHEVDFIKRFIFPGSCIPSVTALSQAAARASNLRLFNIEDHTPHYARTLADWRQNITTHRSKLDGMGFDDNFHRLWEFYLCYCEGGFAERAISSVQLSFGNTDYRHRDHQALGYN